MRYDDEVWFITSSLTFRNNLVSIEYHMHGAYSSHPVLLLAQYNAILAKLAGNNATFKPFFLMPQTYYSLPYIKFSSFFILIRPT